MEPTSLMLGEFETKLLSFVVVLLLGTLLYIRIRNNKNRKDDWR